LEPRCEPYYQSLALTWKPLFCLAQVIGVHMVGPDAPEIMQGVAIALKAGATKAQFDSTVGVHPSAAEELVSMRSRARRIRGRGGDAGGNNRE